MEVRDDEKSLARGREDAPAGVRDARSAQFEIWHKRQRHDSRVEAHHFSPPRAPRAVSELRALRRGGSDVAVDAPRGGARGLRRAVRAALEGGRRRGVHGVAAQRRRVASSVVLAHPPRHRHPIDRRVSSPRRRPPCPSASAAVARPSASADVRAPAPPRDLPSEHFYCNNFREFARRIERARASVGEILARLGVDAARDAATRPDGVAATDEDDAFYVGVVGVLDDHLDAVDRLLDVHARAGDVVGGARAARGGDASSSRVGAGRRDGGGGGRGRDRGGLGFSDDAAARRPQDDFDVPADNADGPFAPPCPHGHADPSAYVPTPGVHPLREALDGLTYDAHPSHAAAPETATAPPPPTGDPSLPATFTYVDTEAALADLASHLDGVAEFAVDLEHHSYRSFRGFTCVIQVSTRERDFVVDALALRSKMRAHLARHFEDATKQKVMHGADMDVQWLQRDFGIYVVNMFDTGQAARVLELPSKGLGAFYLTDAGPRTTASAW